MLKKVLFVICLLFNRTSVVVSSMFSCQIPDGCRFEGIYDGLKEKKFGSIFCDINNDEFEFKFNELPIEPNVTYQSCNDLEERKQERN